jgi:subtilisin family serine protease
VKRILTTCLAILFLGLFGAVRSDAVEYDYSRVIVRLRSAAAGPVAITKGSSGRPEFDKLVSNLRVERIDQLMPHAPSADNGRRYAEQLRLHDYAVVHTPTGTNPQQFIAELRKSPEIESAEFDVIIRAVSGTVNPDDTYFGANQYALVNTGTQPPWDPGTADADIDMDEGWTYTTGDSSVILAILDTGLDPNHPEFAGRFWINPDEEFDDIDNDSNLLVDDVFGWNFNGENNATNDGNGHGTHVAGIAAASGNNGMGVAGVNWHCKVMTVKVLGSDGSGSSSSVTSGIYYAANEGAHIISMSLGAGASSGAQEAAVAYAESLGVIVVAAMGNDDVGTMQWPAAYDGVISVGATDSDDNRADPFCYSPLSGSNYGAWIDVCAPGENVWSTYPVSFGSYANLCGTSMATPHVSGLASLMLGLRPGWTTDSVLHILKNTSDDLVGRPIEDVAGFDIYHGWGRINTARALRILSVEFAPIIVTPDSAEVTENEPLSFGITATDSNLTTLTFSAAPPANATLTDHGDGTATFDFNPDYSQSGEYTIEFIASDGVLADTSQVVITVANGCQCPCHADPGCNGAIDVVDVVNTISVAFRGESSLIDPDCFPNPGGRTDVDCSGSTDIIDVVRMVGVAFRGETPNFCDPCSL